MAQIKGNVKIEIGSEKSFGIVFSVISFGVGLYLMLMNEGSYFYFFLVGTVLLAIAFLVPSVLKIPNKLWFKFGMLLGSILSPLAMAVIYLSTIVPVGLYMKIMGRDLLKKKFDKEIPSYWINREHPVGSMKKQF